MCTGINGDQGSAFSAFLSHCPPYSLIQGLTDPEVTDPPKLTGQWAWGVCLSMWCNYKCTSVCGGDPNLSQAWGQAPWPIEPSWPSWNLFYHLIINLISIPIYCPIGNTYSLERSHSNHLVLGAHVRNLNFLEEPFTKSSYYWSFSDKLSFDFYITEMKQDYKIIKHGIIKVTQEPMETWDRGERVETGWMPSTAILYRHSLSQICSFW